MKSDLPRKRKKKYIKAFGIQEYVANKIISEVLFEDASNAKRFRKIRSFDKIHPEEKKENRK